VSLSLISGAVTKSAVTRPPAASAPLRYQLKQGESLRYSLTADVHGSVPILDSPTPQEINAAVKIVYVATPKTKLADGTMDVEFKVESAELELEKIPLPLPEEEAQKILNQTVSLLDTGEVKKVQEGAPLPFGVSIPGVDPKRLYALIFPIVFPEKAVKPGDKWTFKSELLGGQGTSPVFTATLLPEDGASPTAKRKPVSGAKSVAKPKASGAQSFHVKQDFQMGVDQKLDKDKKPIKDGSSPYYTRQGKIEGSGVFEFDRVRGRMSSGEVTIKADVNQDLIGKPETEDEPKRMTSKVDAKVHVRLEPAKAPGDAKDSKPETKKEKPS